MQIMGTLFTNIDHQSLKHNCCHQRGQMLWCHIIMQMRYPLQQWMLWCHFLMQMRYPLQQWMLWCHFLMKMRYPLQQYTIWDHITMQMRYSWWHVTMQIYLQQYMICGPFYQHGLTLIPAWISNYIHYKVWDEITYPFLNFNGATIEV